MGAISVAGLSDETVALLQQTARERGTDVTTVIRELVDLGLDLQLVPSSGRGSVMAAEERDAAGSTPELPCGLLGSLDTDDPEYLWS